RPERSGRHCRGRQPRLLDQPGRRHGDEDREDHGQSGLACRGNSPSALRWVARQGLQTSPSTWLTRTTTMTGKRALETSILISCLCAAASCAQESPPHYEIPRGQTLPPLAFSAQLSYDHALPPLYGQPWDGL